MSSKLTALCALLLVFASCAEKNDDKVKTVDQNGSVEMKVGISHLNDSLDIMKTENIFWIKGMAVKKVIRLDTIPSLGSTKEVAENTKGDDTTVTIKKNYQIFITVK
ncbi:hypothetical protein [Pedobacter duraquae]|uniref:Uncharacterized protein n=1 Tax=Pedobacter duraquae TaxID=425511 RepID=A0A4R6IPW7_9SPHI|nr:hypothetical protein [Pedobacter duraquae]TDO24364.1 hypothetical protein CLV32_0653 [Pedobacter duraquae]